MYPLYLPSNGVPFSSLLPPLPATLDPAAPPYALPQLAEAQGATKGYSCSVISLDEGNSTPHCKKALW